MRSAHRSSPRAARAADGAQPQGERQGEPLLRVIKIETEKLREAPHAIAKRRDVYAHGVGCGLIAAPGLHESRRRADEFGAVLPFIGFDWAKHTFEEGVRHLLVDG